MNIDETGNATTTTTTTTTIIIIIIIIIDIIISNIMIAVAKIVSAPELLISPAHATELWRRREPYAAGNSLHSQLAGAQRKRELQCLKRTLQQLP
jgi:hypothetical protein